MDGKPSRWSKEGQRFETALGVMGIGAINGEGRCDWTGLVCGAEVSGFWFLGFVGFVEPARTGRENVDPDPISFGPRRQGRVPWFLSGAGVS